MTPGQCYELALAYCASFGGSITSSKRTAAHNKHVGGVEGSAHRYGCGFDVVYDTAPPPAPLAADHAQRLGLRLIREGDHDHLQPWDWPKG